MVEAGVGTLVVVVFVADFAHNLLNDVFHGHQSACTAELVHHNGHVHLVGLEITQKAVNHLCFGHKIGRTDEALPSEVGWLAQMRQQVLDVKHTLDVVLRSLINRNAAVVVLHNAIKHLGERSLHVEVHNINTRSHDFTRHLSTKADDALQHAALLRNVLLVGQFHGFLQVVHGEALCLVCMDALHHHLETDEEGTERIPQLIQYRQHRSGETAEGKRVAGAINLGHNLTEEQQKEGEQNGHEKKLHPCGRTKIYPFEDKIIEQHDDGHIDQIVTDEDGGKQALALVQQFLNLDIGRMLLIVNLVHVCRRKAEKGNFGSRHKAGTKKKHDACAKSNPCPHRRHGRMDLRKSVRKL